MSLTITKSTYLSITCLFLCFVLIHSSSSSSDNENYQIFNVSASLQQTREVFSPSSIRQQQPLNFLSRSSDDHDSLSLTLTLHSLSSLPSAAAAANNNNYTSLTLSRLARDEAHVLSLLSTRSLSLSTSKSKSKSKNKQPSHFQFPIVSGIRQGNAGYLARVGVGRPVRELYVAIDTGSDVNWIQCRPCISCYPQFDPIFNPAASATYKPLACSSRQCAALDVSACSRGTCLYEVSYGDGSYTIGDFATETITFGSSGSVANVAIGCAHDSEGLFFGSAGLLGLGGSSLSLPSQLKATSFSYCLVNQDSSASSTLDFNSTEPADSIVAPMLANSRTDTYFYVGLTGVSIGGRALNIRPSKFAIGRRGRGGVIVDSGTTVTRFPTAVYAEVRDAFRNMSRNLRLAGGFSLFDTCYDLSSLSRVRVPTMSFEFSGGKRLALQPMNYLIPVDSRGKHCFAFAATRGSMSIIGNIQQQGTRVSYNLANKFIGFSPNKC